MLLFQPFRPMLASFGNEAFTDDEFLFDVKWGRRLLVHKQGTRVEAYTRLGRCVTEHFPELREVATAVRAETAVLDCEGIVLREGRPGFDAYLHRLRVRNSVSVKQAMSTHPVTFVALDLLVSGTEELLHQPLEERKKRLQDVVATSALVMFSPFVVGRGTELYTQAAERGLEGVVAKRRNSIYVPDTRSREWIKIKVPQEIDCLILGYRLGPPFTLVLGLHFPTVRA